MCKIPQKRFLKCVKFYIKSDYSIKMKGAITENFVLQSLLPHLENEPCYWTSEGKAEIDYVAQIGTGVYPIEVNASKNLSGQSLKSYSDKYNPDLLIRLADTDLSLTNKLLSLPLPLAYKFKEYVKEAGKLNG